MMNKNKYQLETSNSYSNKEISNKIIGLLSFHKKPMPTRRISIYLKVNYDKTKSCLENLEQKGVIKCEHNINRKSWSILPEHNLKNQVKLSKNQYN